MVDREEVVVRFSSLASWSGICGLGATSILAGPIRPIGRLGRRRHRGFRRRRRARGRTDEAIRDRPMSGWAPDPRPAEAGAARQRDRLAGGAKPTRPGAPGRDSFRRADRQRAGCERVRAAVELPGK